MIDLLFGAIAYVCVATVITLALLAGYFWHTDQLNNEKMFRLLAVMQDVDLQQMAAEQGTSVAELRRAVAAMTAHMQQRQQAFSADMNARLEGTLAALRQLQGRQIEQLELRLARQGGLENLRAGKRERRVGQIRRVFDDYEAWVRDSLQTEPQPHIQVLAAVCR